MTLHRMTVYLTADQLAAIDRRRATAGLPRATYLRTVLAQALTTKENAL